MMSDALDFTPDFAGPGDWAGMYRAVGLQVVPALTHEEDPIQWKRPALPQWKQLEHEMVPDLTFERWYGPAGTYARRQNMGMITGSCSGNAFVLDLDTQKHESAAHWWLGLLASENNSDDVHTLRQTTGGGGVQMIFRAPAGVEMPTFKTSIGVDVRGEGGFAMLPPSRHESGREYAWNVGREPWNDCEIEDAPQWLLDAIFNLAAEHGWRGNSKGGNVRTATPEAVVNAFNQHTDNREDYMTRLVWGAVVDWWRECPIRPSQEESDARMREAFELYLMKVATRIDQPGTPKHVLLEREGRGIGMFADKWQRAMAKWDGEVADEGKKPKPGKLAGEAASAAEFQQQTPLPSKPLKLIDFATLILSDVVEEPDYIEPAVVGPGGFMVIAGPPKAQKSFLLQEILVACATGTGFLGHFKVPRPLRVFYLQAEMNEKLLRKRAKVMTDLTPTQIDTLASNLIVTDRFRMVLTDEGVKAAVEAMRDAFMGEAPDIIAIDPLANVYDQEDESNNTQMMRFLNLRVEAIRQAVNPMAAIIMVHHATKKTADEIARDPFICIRGGGALRGYYDAGLVMFKKSELGQEREIHFEFRSGEAPEPMTIKLNDGRFTKAEDTPREPTVSSADLDFLLDEIDRRWKARDPFAIGPQGKRLTLEVYLMRRLNLSRQAAKMEVERLVGDEVIRPEIYDAKRKVSGWKLARNRGG